MSRITNVRGLIPVCFEQALAARFLISLLHSLDVSG